MSFNLFPLVFDGGSIIGWFDTDDIEKAKSGLNSEHIYASKPNGSGIIYPKGFELVKHKNICVLIAITDESKIDSIYDEGCNEYITKALIKYYDIIKSKPISAI